MTSDEFAKNSALSTRHRAMPSPRRSAACFMLKVKPELLDEYRALHSPVWPEMLNAIRDAGWSNYTIFDRGDGTIVGYFEADDVDLAREDIERSKASRAWALATAHLFEEAQVWLDPLFNLEDQLRNSGKSTSARLR